MSLWIELAQRKHPLPGYRLLLAIKFNPLLIVGSHRTKHFDKDVLFVDVDSTLQSSIKKAASLYRSQFESLKTTARNSFFQKNAYLEK